MEGNGDSNFNENLRDDDKSFAGFFSDPSNSAYAQQLASAAQEEQMDHYIIEEDLVSNDSELEEESEHSDAESQESIEQNVQYIYPPHGSTSDSPDILPGKDTEKESTNMMDKLKYEAKELTKKLNIEREKLYNEMINRESAERSLKSMELRLNTAENALKHAYSETSDQSCEQAREISKLKSQYEQARISLEGKTAAYDVLVKKLNEQEVELAKSLEKVFTLERENAVLRFNSERAIHNEQLAQKELVTVSDELLRTLEASAEVQQELAAQEIMVNEIKDEAVKKAFAGLQEELQQNEFSTNKQVRRMASSVLNYTLKNDENHKAWRQKYLVAQEQLARSRSRLSELSDQIKDFTNTQFEQTQYITNLEREIKQMKSEKLSQNLRITNAERDTRVVELQKLELEQRLSDMTRRVMSLLLQKMYSVKQLSTAEQRELDAVTEENRKTDRQHLLESLELNGYDKLKAQYARQGQDTITEKGLAMKDISTLVFQNEALVSACRNLAKLLSPTGTHSAEQLTAFTFGLVEEVKNAGSALLKMQQRATDLRVKVDKLTVDLSASETNRKIAEEREKKSKNELETSNNLILELKKQNSELKTSQRDLNHGQFEIELMQKIQELSKQVINTNTEFSKQSIQLQQVNSEFLGSQRALGKSEELTENLKVKLSELKGQLKSSEAQSEMLQLKLDNYRTQETELLQQISGQKEKILMYVERITDLERAGQISDVVALVETQKKQQNELKETNSKLESTINSMEDTVSALEKENSDLKSTIAALESSHESLKVNFSQIKDELSQTKIKLSQAHDELSQAKKETSDAKSELTHAHTKVSQVQDELSNAKRDAEFQRSIKEQLESAEKRNNFLEDKVNDLEDQITEALNDRDSALNDFRELQSKNSEPNESELKTKSFTELRDLISTVFPNAIKLFESQFADSRPPSSSSSSFGTLQKKLLSQKIAALETKNKELMNKVEELESCGVKRPSPFTTDEASKSLKTDE